MNVTVAHVRMEPRAVTTSACTSACVRPASGASHVGWTPTSASATPAGMEALVKMAPVNMSAAALPVLMVGRACEPHAISWPIVCRILLHGLWRVRALRALVLYGSFSKLAFYMGF